MIEARSRTCSRAGVLGFGTNDDIVLIGAKQGMNLVSVDIEEARSCLFSLYCAYKLGAHDITIEGNNLSLIHMLQVRSSHYSYVGIFVGNILSSAEKFDFYY